MYYKQSEQLNSYKVNIWLTELNICNILFALYDLLSEPRRAGCTCTRAGGNGANNSTPESGRTDSRAEYSKLQRRWRRTSPGGGVPKRQAKGEGGRALGQGGVGNGKWRVMLNVCLLVCLAT